MSSPVRPAAAKSLRTQLLERLFARRGELPADSPERMVLDDTLAEAMDVNLAWKH